MKLILFVLFSLSSIASFCGGPWVPEKKSGFFQLQTNLPLGPTERLFLEKGNELKIERDVYDLTFQAYMEYGIANKTAIVLNVPYKLVSAKDATPYAPLNPMLQAGTLTGLGNTGLTIKRSLCTDKFNAAISLQGLFDTGTEALEKGLATAFLTNSIGLYLHAGKSFSEKWYSFIEGGYNMRSNGFSDYVEVHYELGHRVSEPLWLSFVVDYKESIKNGNFNNVNLRRTGLFTNDQEYFAYGIKGAYEINNGFGINAATFGAFSGNYSAKVATINLGFFKKW